MKKTVVPGARSRLTIVDHNETYGRNILAKAIRNERIEICVDLGCGGGDDLSVVSQAFPQAKLIGVDFGNWNIEKLISLGIEQISLNIENEKFPFEDNSLDCIIANQVIEHTKEVFWINHEVFRCLKTGGIFYMGVPNLLSLHNRILMLFGFHPTSSKMISAHVRALSKHDVLGFYKNIGKSFCKVEKIWGSQFYPFPKPIARFLSSIFPSLAFSSFYLIRKTGEYNGEFISYPKIAALETNYYTGQ